MPEAVSFACNNKASPKQILTSSNAGTGIWFTSTSSVSKPRQPSSVVISTYLPVSVFATLGTVIVLSVSVLPSGFSHTLTALAESTFAFNVSVSPSHNGLLFIADTTSGLGLMYNLVVSDTTQP
eukprot:TRINITY_DN82164_c0_g1_i1.p3 TRINITY_DN82164_c0_g1~~TRINITY_DN82164_c0_g1_i1.p3  ORF type:complete len:124 (-),score=14.59 TRINITY_DN82164_c0_g1_i1:240-611(-)